MKTTRLYHSVLKHGLFVLFFCCAVNPLLYAQAPVYYFNSEGFVNRVREANLQLKVSREEKELGQKATKEALAAMLPQVNFQGGYQRNFNEQYLYIEFLDLNGMDPETGEFPVTLQKFDAGFKNDFHADFLLQQNILSFKAIYDLKMSHIYSDIEELKYSEKVNEIIANAKKMFLQTVLMGHVYELNRLTEKNTRENYLVAKSKFENKLISEMDLLQAKINWENEIPKTKQARRDYHVLLGSLKVIAGLDVADSVVLENQDAFVAESFPELSVTEILERRDDYRILGKNVDLQKASVKKEKSEFAPTITGQLGYSYQSNSDKWKYDENVNKPFYAGVTLSIPIFSGGYRSTQVQKAKINHRISELQEQDAEQQIRVEIKNLQMKLQEEADIVKSAETTLNTAQKGYDLAVKTLETGLISQMDFRKYSEDLKKARLNLCYAIYNYECTKIDYNKSIGNKL